MGEEGGKSDREIKGRGQSQRSANPSPGTSRPEPSACSSPWSSWPRCGLTGRSSSAGHPAPAWTGICPRSGRSPSPPWRPPGRPAAWASGSVCAGSGSRQACCGWSYWQYCRGQRKGTGEQGEPSSDRKRLHPEPCSARGSPHGTAGRAAS